jgi:hypothetical protein
MDIPITLLEFLIETLFHVAFEREKVKKKKNVIHLLYSTGAWLVTEACLAAILVELDLCIVLS